MKRIERLREVPVFDSSYGTLFNDLVRGPEGSEGHYLRWKWHRGSVIAVPRRGPEVAMALSYRYAVQRQMLEFPRGFCEPLECVTDAAIREIAEELGLKGQRAQLLGNIVPGFSGLDSSRRSGLH